MRSAETVVASGSTQRAPGVLSVDGAKLVRNSLSSLCVHAMSCMTKSVCELPLTPVAAYLSSCRNKFFREVTGMELTQSQTAGGTFFLRETLFDSTLPLAEKLL